MSCCEINLPLFQCKAEFTQHLLVVVFSNVFTAVAKCVVNVGFMISLLTSYIFTTLAAIFAKLQNILCFSPLIYTFVMCNIWISYTFFMLPSLRAASSSGRHADFSRVSLAKRNCNLLRCTPSAAYLWAGNSPHSPPPYYCASVESCQSARGGAYKYTRLQVHSATTKKMKKYHYHLWSSVCEQGLAAYL